MDKVTDLEAATWISAVMSAFALVISIISLVQGRGYEKTNQTLLNMLAQAHKGERDRVDEFIAELLK